jgi:hypothetical protein
MQSTDFLTTVGRDLGLIETELGKILQLPEGGLAATDERGTHYALPVFTGGGQKPVTLVIERPATPTDPWRLIDAASGDELFRREFPDFFADRLVTLIAFERINAELDTIGETMDAIRQAWNALPPVGTPPRTPDEARQLRDLN